MFYRHIVSVERLQQSIADADKEGWQPVGNMAQIPADVQPAGGEKTVLAEGVYGKTYSIYLTASGIIVGDRLTVLNTTLSGLKVIVRGIEDWNSGPLPHYEMTAVEAGK
jgi:hypothetical protein